MGFENSLTIHHIQSASIMCNIIIVCLVIILRMEISGHFCVTTRTNLPTYWPYQTHDGGYQETATGIRNSPVPQKFYSGWNYKWRGQREYRSGRYVSYSIFTRNIRYYSTRSLAHVLPCLIIVQCIGEAFGVDADNPEHQAKYATKRSLLSLFSVALQVEEKLSAKQVGYSHKELAAFCLPSAKQCICP